MNDGRKRRRGQPEKDFQSRFVPMPSEWFDTPEFRGLSPMATKIFLAAWLQFNGKNNGDISLHRKLVAAWGCTGERQRTKAIAELLNAGWLIRTRRGGLRMGPDLFAVSVKPIDPCINPKTGLSKHDMKPGAGYSHLWRSSRADLRESVTVRDRTDPCIPGRRARASCRPHSGGVHDITLLHSG